jgi:hypothetical protein
MKRIWGDGIWGYDSNGNSYDDACWHKVVGGYHFFGFGWPDGEADNRYVSSRVEFYPRIYEGRMLTPQLNPTVDNQGNVVRPKLSRFVHYGLWMVELVRKEIEDGNLSPTDPFFIANHASIDRYDRDDFWINQELTRLLCGEAGNGKPNVEYRNAFGFFGHGHHSVAEWNFTWQNYACFPSIHCAACSPWESHGAEGENARFASGFGRGKAEHIDDQSHALLVYVYSNALVIHRVWVGLEPERSGTLGPDWVLPFEDVTPTSHPFRQENLKQVIGTPEFQPGAELQVVWNNDSISVVIPKADATDSRMYGYNVEIVGAGGSLRKNVYASGYSYGIGYEPDDGVTTLVIPKSELPAGNNLTFRVHPCSSLATRGAPLVKTEKCLPVTLENAVANVNQDARFAVTSGANIPDGYSARIVVSNPPPWFERACVEDGEIVVYTRPVGASVRIK